MPTSPHQISVDLVTDDQGRKVLITCGDVHLQTAPVLRRHIERTAESGETIVIDLREVTYMDSPGLGTLVHCDRVQRERGGHLVMKDPTGPVRELFEVAGVADVIAIE